MGFATVGQRAQVLPARFGVRFWRRVAPANRRGCRLWRGARNKGGYGVLVVGGVFWLAHRAAWTLAHGPIPAGLLACHHCNVPLCCEPTHLFLGTQVDSMAEMAAKGRRRSTRGTTYRRANRLTVKAVRAIRRAHQTGRVSAAGLARHWAVTERTIWHIVRRQTWPTIS